MKTRVFSTKLIVATCSILLFVLGAFTPTAVADDKGGPRCRFEGTWIGARAHETVTSVGSSNKEVTLAMSFRPADPTWTIPPLCVGFPNATGTTVSRGGALRTGNRTFDYTLVAYGIGPSTSLEYIVVAYGEKVIAEDCNSYQVTSTFEFYNPQADADGNGLPDEGEVPKCIFTGVIGNFLALSLE